MLKSSYQKTLVYLGLEDISAVFMLPEIGGGQDVNKNGLWTSAVADFLYANFLVGLIEISSGQELLQGNDAPELLRAVYLNSSPQDRPEIWMGVQFAATKRLLDFLEFHNLLQWGAISEKVNQDFIDLIFDLYEKNDIAISSMWTKKI